MCKWCEQPEDGGLDLGISHVDLCALGKMEMTASMWTYCTDSPFVLVDLWFEALRGAGGDSLASIKITINYCPFCGKKLEEARNNDA